MSLVEKALKKLKAGGGIGTVAAQPSAPLRVGKVIDVDPVGLVGVPQARPRGSLGSGTRAVHIDHAALRTHGFLPPEKHERELAHQFRTIKRPLIRHAFPMGQQDFGHTHTHGRSVMVASALPGEGKTFTAVNLALSIALEKDYSALLVDGDVAKPNVSQIFGASAEPGLLDLLSDPQRNVESVILSTDMPRLSILPAGTQSDVATELLASGRMRQVLDRLESLDSQVMIIVDSPPILLTSEARVMAGLFEQVVLVVRAGSTPQHAVLDAIASMGEKPGLSLVLNQATPTGLAANYYGFGHAYGLTADGN